MQHYAHNQPQVTLHFQPKHMALVDEIKQILKTSLSDHPNFDMIASAFNISGRTLKELMPINAKSDSDESLFAFF